MEMPLGISWWKFELVAQSKASRMAWKWVCRWPELWQGVSRSVKLHIPCHSLAPGFKIRCSDIIDISRWWLLVLLGWTATMDYGLGVLGPAHAWQAFCIPCCLANVEAGVALTRSLVGLAFAPLSWGLARNPCACGPLQHPCAESHPLSERHEVRGRKSFALVNSHLLKPLSASGVPPKCNFVLSFFAFLLVFICTEQSLCSLLGFLRLSSKFHEPPKNNASVHWGIFTWRKQADHGKF